MFVKKINKGIVAAFALLSVLFLSGVTGASAMSVDVTGLSYSDDSGRNIVYNFSSGTVGSETGSILLNEVATITRPSGETDTSYFWGDASAVMSEIPGVTAVKIDSGATVSPATAGATGVAVLYATGTVPAASETPAWTYNINLRNFNVDLTAQKAYFFNVSLGRPTEDYNEATVEVIWVKGFYNGTLYTQNTLIVQAIVRSSGTQVWYSTPPIVRTGLDPAATNVALQLDVTGGNHFAPSVNINGEGSQLLASSGYDLSSGQFLRFPDLYPVLVLEEESASTEPQAIVQSSHFQTGDTYSASFFVTDPLHQASAVRVTGVGNAYDQNLTWDETNVNWYSTVNYEMGSEPQSTPYPSFLFTFTPQSGGASIDSVTKSVTGYVSAFASNLLPTGDVSTTPVFSWMGIAGALNYGIELSDASTGNRVWDYYGIPETEAAGSQHSFTYNGPALETGKTYTYLIRSQVEQGDSLNASLSASASFTYTGTASSTISFSGWVKTLPSWPSTEGMAPAAGATVMAYLAGTSPTLINTASVDGTTGAFTVTGIPASSIFYLVAVPPTGYLPALSKFMSSAENIQALLPFVLFTSTQYSTTLGNTAGTGIILGRVALKSSPETFLAGATIVATEYVNGSPTSTTFPVTYNSTTGSTGDDGVYLVKDVPAGTAVQLAATLAGHTFEFNNAVISAQANNNVVSEESFFATPVAATISFSGVVKKYADDTAYSGALVEQAGNPSVNITTGADGTFTLTGLPSGTEYSVKITGDGTYVPTYTRIIRTTENITADRNYNLFTQANLTDDWGVSSGSGVIRGRVINSENTGAGYVSGAVVTYRSQLNRTDYVVKYEDQFNVLSTGTGTTANGKYYILNVAEGDTVTVTATHPDYTFPLLTDANARKFDTHADSVSEGIIKGSRVAGRVAIGGYIKNSDIPAVGIKGATVEQVGQTVPLNATVSNADGAVYMTVPPGATFYLKVSKPQAGTPPAPTYSAEMSFTADALSLGDYNLFPPTKLTDSVGSGGWGITAGKGIIRGRVKDNTGTNLGGATVSCTSSLGQTYTVCYDDDCSGTFTSTQATGVDAGRYVIKNVEPNDTVTVTAAREGYTFNSRVFHTYANSLHQGGPVGTALDENTIRSRFEALLAEYNKGASGDIATVMSYFSTAYLHDGQDYAGKTTDMQSGMTAGEARTYTGATVTVSGDGLSAIMVITWSNGETETMYWAKESGVWLIVGNQARHDVRAYSQHWSDGYHASFSVEDTAGTQTLTSVTVTGPEITGSLNLTYDANSGYWYPMTGTPFLGATVPTETKSYTITVTEAGIEYPYTRTITGYVTDLPTIQSPSGSYGTPVVFVWRGVPGASRYAVELNDSLGNRIWEKRRISRNQWGVVYDGTALTAGAYTYNIVAEADTGDGSNQSFGQGSFTYTASGQGVITYTSYIKDTIGNAISGALIEHANAFNTGSAPSDANGLFTLGNALARTPFHFKLSASASYLPTYTAYMRSNANIDDTASSYNLFIPSEFTTMGGVSGKGVIWGRVRDDSRNKLAGAIVTAWSALGKSYEIRYYDELGENYRTTDGTYASGRFAVVNVEPDDRVVVNAQLGVFDFSNPRVFQTYADAVSQGGISADGSCTYTIDPASYSLGASETSRTVNVTTAAGCTWGAKSNNDGWLVMDSVSTDNGSGTVAFTVTANAGDERTGTITIAGQTLNVTQAAYVAPVNNLLSNGTFDAGIDSWTVNPAVRTGTPVWTPLVGDGTVSLSPTDSSVMGTILYQNLNVTGVSGKTLTFSMDLTKTTTFAGTGAVAVYVTYLDTGGTLNRAKITLTPDGATLAKDTATSVGGTLTLPSGAQKIVKLELARENYGGFKADNIVLYGDGLTMGATPIITGLSSAGGAFETSLTITGQNFGTETGTVLIGGVEVTVTAWSDTSITVTVNSAARSGNVLVIAGKVESNTDRTFQITSPYFTVDVMNTIQRVIRGQKGEFVLKTAVYNGFTAAGGSVGLELQNASELAGRITFSPGASFSGNGGVLLSIDTTGLATGTYYPQLWTNNNGTAALVGTLQLQVVTVSDIVFYGEMAQTTPIAAKTATAQGMLDLYYQVMGSDSQAIGNTDTLLAEVPGGDGNILGVYRNLWGYDLYAVKNGATTLRATAPDGYTEDFPVTVSIPDGSQLISSITVTPATIANNYTGDIVYQAEGNTAAPGSIGFISSMENFQTNFFTNYVTEGNRKSSTFQLTGTADLGTVLFTASTADASAESVAPLYLVNDSAAGLLSCTAKPVDVTYVGGFTLVFHDATTGASLFTRHVSSGAVSLTGLAAVGNIPAGSYKILFIPDTSSDGIGRKPQWWPNAETFEAAQAVGPFAAGATVADVVFFALSQPAGSTVALGTTSLNLGTAEAGTGSVNVTVTGGASWAAATADAWITITAGASGTGSGTVYFSVAANTLSAARTGTIKIGGQTFTVTQAGTGISPAYVGTWGAQQLIHFDPGYDQVDGIGSVPWYAEISRTTFNEDLSGTIVMTKNDHNGEKIEQTVGFTYMATANTDGSIAMTLTMGSNTETVRMVISDDGQIGIVDGIGKVGQQKLMALFKIDETKTYSASDLNGAYYNVGFERNMTDVVDPPDGNGAFMAISGIHTFDGAGTYSYAGKANSVLQSDGSSYVWTDTGKTGQAYAVSSDGKMTVGGGAFGGWFIGSGLVGGGGGAFNGTSESPVNNQLAYFFLKQGDKSGGYATSDMAGKWTLVSFGQGSSTTYATYASQIGTMSCDTAGVCNFKFRDRRSDGTTNVSSGSATLTVLSDGSFGASLASGAPSYAGAIGNNGNTLFFNTGFNPDEVWHREIFLGIRTENIGDLAASGILPGDLDGNKTVNLADAIIAMKVLSGVTPTIRGDYVTSGTDVNGDNRVGLEELLYILQVVGGLR